MGATGNISETRKWRAWDKRGCSLAASPKQQPGSELDEVGQTEYQASKRQRAHLTAHSLKEKPTQVLGSVSSAE